MKSRYLYDNILCFIQIIHRNYTRSYDIQIFPYPAVGVIFENLFYLVYTSWWVQILQVL